MGIDAARIAEVVRTRFKESSASLGAFWVPVASDRGSYAEELRREFAGLPIAVLPVRIAGFDNPNSVLLDLMRVIEAERPLVEEALSFSEEGRFGVVLLARARLSLSQASSPVTLPEWFPVQGGYSVSAIIEDLSLSADAALNCTEVSVPLLCEGLFSLEAALLRRLTEVASTANGDGQHLFEVVKRGGDTTYAALLACFAASRRTVASPEAYRPSLREGDSLVARLWELGHQRNPEEGAPSKALARALGMPGDAVLSRESLSTVLRRPSGSAASPAVRFTRNVLATLASSCQLITASAHADAYGRFPVTLLETYSYDLRRAMLDLERLILSLPPVARPETSRRPTATRAEQTG